MLVIGATYANSDVPTPGAAYVFVGGGTNWSQQAKLQAGDDPGPDFGQSVCLSGDALVIGAWGDDENGFLSGSAYVFARSGSSWIEQAKLLASDGSAEDRFGGSVSIFGDTIVVGAASNDASGATSGAAYVFVRSGTSWSEQAKLVAGDAAPEDRFGVRVSVSGDTALIGAYRDDDAGSDSGSAYVFVRSGTTWIQQAKLVASDGAPQDGFGASVCVSEDTVLVGASGDDDAGSGSGCAYVFVRSGTTWMQTQKLLASDGSAGDGFGAAVHLSGDTAGIGAPWDGDAAPFAGSAYVFLRGGALWSEQAKLVASDTDAFDEFGWAIAAAGDVAVVGALSDEEAGAESGAAYAFVLPARSGTVFCACAIGPCGNSDPEAGCANSTGGGALCIARGSTSPDELNLLVLGARPGQLGVFVEGNDAVAIPFGDGFRCAGGGLVRITRPPVRVDPSGSAGYGPCFGDPTVSSTTGAVPGSGAMKRYQFWYRDPAGPCGSGFNLSNGWEIVW